MRVCLLGGAGVISSSVSELFATLHEVTCVMRSAHPLPPHCRLMRCDVNDESALTALLRREHFDAVVDFITFTPEQAQMRIRCFEGLCDRYVFVSTATVYEKPPRRPVISEATPAVNPFSPYAQKKILCEEVFRASAMPVTVVRPFMTYGNTMIPFILRPRQAPYTLVRRMREGKPILVPGDGNIFATCTHAMDTARALHGIITTPATARETLNVVSDECHSWNEIAALIAEAAGAQAPRLVHVASDRLVEAEPSLLAELHGDKAHPAVFDNSKIKSLLPGFACQVSLREGLRRTIGFMDAHGADVDSAWDSWCDDMIARYGA